MTETVQGIASTQSITIKQVRDAITQATGLDMDVRALDYLKPARPILLGAIATGYHEGIRQVVERALRQPLTRAGITHRINLYLIHLVTSRYGWDMVHAAIAGGVAAHPDTARLSAVLEHHQRTGELPEDAHGAAHQARSAA